MVDSKDITPEYMQSRYESKKLQELKVDIPNVKRFVGGDILVKIDMQNLWKYVANLHTLPINLSKVDKEKVTPENISSVCIYGSILYKHFPTEFTKNVKPWFGLGKEHVKTIKRKRTKPGDLDLMVITKEPVGGELFFPGMENLAKISGNKKIWDGYGGEIVNRERGLKLHLTYRSEEQFLKTYEKGDKLSHAVMEYGLPLVGESNFEKMILSVPASQRDPLHEIHWKDNGGWIYASIEEKNKAVLSKTPQVNITRPKKKSVQKAKIEPPQTGFINIWDIDIPKVKQELR